MLAKVASAAVVGLDAIPITVEIDIASQGLPSLTIVGLPDKAVEESRERVRSALRNSGADLPPRRITVNLAPADLPKEGPAYDLPIALGILFASEQLRLQDISDSIFLGELSLDGSLRRIWGVLPCAIMARDKKFKNIFVPTDNLDEARIINKIKVYPVKNLRQLFDHFALADKKISPARSKKQQFKNIEDVQNDEYKNEPWGAFRYLLFASSFFKKVTPEQAGNFVKPEIISCLNRFILYLLTPEEFEDEAKDQKGQYSFDKKRAVLKVKDKEIPFKKETRKIEFLTLLAKSPKYVYFSEVAEELDGANKEALKNAKNTYYEVCRGIEARLLKKGVSDFLDYNYNRARIYPRYKRTSS